MGSNDVVSIRVEALGVSITIAGGSIAIEQSKTEPAAGVTTKELNSAVTTERMQASHRALPAHWNGSAALPEDDRQAAVESPQDAVLAGPPTEDVVLTGPPGDSGMGFAHSGTAIPAGETKPAWTDEEVEKLRALYPTHSASAIATQLGRGRNAVRSKAQHLGLKKDGPPTVTSKPAKAAPKPRSLSAAVTADPVLTALPGFPEDDAIFAAPPDDTKSNPGTTSRTVSLFDHRPGQCRWIVSDVWPAIYCGAPVVDSSSWCGQHSRRVFKPQDITGPKRFRLRAWPC
jgi:hypothetical protein